LSDRKSIRSDIKVLNLEVSIIKVKAVFVTVDLQETSVPSIMSIVVAMDFVVSLGERACLEWLVTSVCPCVGLFSVANNGTGNGVLDFPGHFIRPVNDMSLNWVGSVIMW
jgi:hypothetical protein